MIDISGKVALVTGGSRGIGKAIALQLASAGADVAINYSSREEEALEVKKEIEAMGRKAFVIKANVASMEETENMISEVAKELGSLDILVNNAGITKDNLLIKMKEEDFDKVIDINLKGTFNCIKCASKLMIKKRQGRIINMASVVGIVGNPGQANYCASKAGVIGMTKSLAKELAGRNININAVAPGFIDTDMTKVLKDEAKDAMVKNIPLGRGGTPEDIAKAVLFLSSSLSDYITGQVINVDGGMVM